MIIILSQKAQVFTYLQTFLHRLYHAITANDLPVSKSTVYRHIEKGYYTISKIDLPRAVKFKPRSKGCRDYVPKGIRIGRSYDDFLRFMEDHPGINCVEMDKRGSA